MDKISNEEVARGCPGLFYPTNVSFSPDGKKLLYLYPDFSGKRQIYSIDIESLGDSKNLLEPSQWMDMTSAISDSISLEELLRRERMRSFSSGVTNYEWNKAKTDSMMMIVPLNGQIFIIDSTHDNKELHLLYDGSLGSAIDPHLSPDGTKIAYVINNDLYVQQVPLKWTEDTDTPPPLRLTSEGSINGMSCGVADYIAQEEMDRYRGFWWSPNSTRIVYCVNDERHIPEFEILHQGENNPHHSEKHRYPFAGAENPQVKLKIVDLSQLSNHDHDNSRCSHIEIDSKTLCTKQVDSSDYYIGRVDWWPDGSIMIQTENRDQTILHLLRVDIYTGKSTIVLEEISDIWINFHNDLYCFEYGWKPSSHQTVVSGEFYFIWASERSGYKLLYLYQYDPSQQKGICLLEGKPIGLKDHYVVDSICDVDETREIVYFSSSYTSPIEQHLYCVSFATSSESNIQQLTTGAGWHISTVNAKLGYFTDVYSSTTQPYITSLNKLSHSHSRTNQKGIQVKVENTWVMYDVSEGTYLIEHYKSILRPPVFKEVQTKDKKETLYCAAYYPDPVEYGTSGPFPVVVSVYGGPHVQRVYNQWLLTTDLRAQKLSQNGYLVIKCDNRGSYRRGVAFEGAIKHNMGYIELEDQITAVESYGSLVDTNQVGIFGWSYGGYLSAMAVCRFASHFKCAIAGAPVTSWDGYDTHYTERYMGRPQYNPDGYDNSSVMTWASGLTGSLLLIHGLIDENVHFRHTARLINKFIETRKSYELILFPNERHSPHKLTDRIYMEDKIMEFLDKCLKN